MGGEWHRSACQSPFKSPWAPSEHPRQPGPPWAGVTEKQGLEQALAVQVGVEGPGFPSSCPSGGQTRSSNGSRLGVSHPSDLTLTQTTARLWVFQGKFQASGYRELTHQV